MITIGSILIQLRKNSNYTQEAVAQSIGVTARTLYNYENVLVPISDRRLMALCEFYDISFEKLNEMLRRTNEEAIKLEQELTENDILAELFSDSIEFNSDDLMDFKENSCLSNEDFYRELNWHEKQLKNRLEQKSHGEYCEKVALKISVQLTKFIQDKSIDKSYKFKVALELLTKLFDFLNNPQ